MLLRFNMLDPAEASATAVQSCARLSVGLLLLAGLLPASLMGQGVEPSPSRTAMTPTARILLNPPAAVNVDSFPGADLGAKLTAAQASLGGTPATLVIAAPGTVSTGATLNAGNTLEINAAVLFTATVTLAGNNKVTCASAGQITISRTPALSSTANNLQVEGCTARGTIGGATLLETHGSNITVDHNTLTSAALLSAKGGAHLQARNNRFDSPTMYQGYAIVWQGSNDVVIDSNQVNNYLNPFEFFNANADPGCYSKAGACAGQTYPGTRALIEALGGHYTFSNNTCTHAGACYWGSAGHDIHMINNHASGCQDVCYDVEGSIDAMIEHNSGDGAANGVGSTFFFSDHVTFASNSFSSDKGAPLVRIFNSSINPLNDEYLTVQGNTLTCEKVLCQAVGGDPADHVSISHNTITNGLITFSNSNGNGSLSIVGNTQNFTVTNAAPFNAIMSSQTLDSGLVLLSGNTISGVAQPAGSNCIAIHQSDYNSTATLRVENNRCIGGFPTDIVTVNAGTNAGTGVITTLSGNVWSHNAVVHQHPTGNVDRYSNLGPAR